jgi:hypothetical protein
MHEHEQRHASDPATTKGRVTRHHLSANSAASDTEENGDRGQLASYVIDVPLSVLDLSPVAAGTTAGQALRQTTELACRAEKVATGLQATGPGE